jgi:hypothetical protein
MEYSNNRRIPWALFSSELIGPLTGMLLSVFACSFRAKRIEVAKLYYFESDRDRLFRRMARPRSPRKGDVQ